jgi:hypothetical protein
LDKEEEEGEMEASMNRKRGKRIGSIHLKKEER